VASQRKVLTRSLLKASTFFERAVEAALGVGAVTVGSSDAFEFGFGPFAFIRLAGADLGFDTIKGALTTPENPAAMSRVFNERLLVGVGGLVVIDKASD